MTVSNTDIGAPMAARREHDRLCQAEPLNDIYFCACEFIAEIRADERERNKPLYTAALMQHMQDRLDLRAKVEALPSEHHYGAKPSCVSRADVIALIDGGSDD